MSLLVVAYFGYPPQYQVVDLHYVLMIFETSVLMHFGYLLKIPE